MPPVTTDGLHLRAAGTAINTARADSASDGSASEHSDDDDDDDDDMTTPRGQKQQHHGKQHHQQHHDSDVNANASKLEPYIRSRTEE